jgi:hypothetical protein
MPLPLLLTVGWRWQHLNMFCNTQALAAGAYPPADGAALMQLLQGVESLTAQDETPAAAAKPAGLWLQHQTHNGC